MTQPDDRPIRWGILATGGIAHSLRAMISRCSRTVRLSPSGHGRRLRRTSFGDEFGVPHRHASYQALVSDPDVDAVYVSTPHPGHHDAALLAINAG